jgi:hypothetical protein
MTLRSESLCDDDERSKIFSTQYTKRNSSVMLVNDSASYRIGNFFSMCNSIRMGADKPLTFSISYLQHNQKNFS